MSYNQDYLIHKFNNIEFFGHLFISLILLSFLIGAIWVFLRYMRRDLERENIEKEEARERLEDLRKKEKEKTDQQERQQVFDIFNKFQEICRLIQQDLNVFKRPEKMVKDMYYPHMKELISEMSKHPQMLHREFRYLATDYEHYRKEIMKDKE